MNVRPDPTHTDASRLEDTSRALADWFEMDAPAREPVHLLSATLYRTARTRRRAPWRNPERWLPMTSTARRPLTASPLGLVFMALMAALLALTLAAGALLVGSQPTGRNDQNDTLDALPAAALLPTSCAAGTPLKSGDIATIAGTGRASPSGDGGPAIAARVDAGAIAVDAAGAVYFSQGTSIRRIGPDGLVGTFVGPRSGAAFVFPAGLAFDAAGDLLIADPGNLRTSYIWRVDPDGNVTTVAGNGVFGSSGNEGPALDAEIAAAMVTVGPQGDLYFDDLNAFRTVDTGGVIHAFAGTGVAGFSGDNGPALEATIGVSDPVTLGVAADGAGNVYVGDPSNHRIRKVDSAGVITTVAGTGIAGQTGDRGPAVDATVDSPGQLAVDAAGDLFFTDIGSVRKIDVEGVITTVAGTGVAGYGGDCGPAVEAQVAPAGVAVHDGIVYIADEGNYRIRMIVP